MNKYGSNGSDAIGKEAEKSFYNLAESKGWTIIKAEKEQDRKEHWDYALRKGNKSYLIEVKGLKRLNSKVRQDDKLICIELMGVSGWPGWLYGQATHIAFLMKEGFIFVERKALIKLIESLIHVDSPWIPTVPKKEPHIIYRRSQWGKRDKIVYITKDELTSISHKIWEA